MKFIKNILLFIVFAALAAGFFRYGPDFIKRYLITGEDISKTPEALIKQLGLDNADKRWDAYNKLADIGESALPLLKKSAESAKTDEKTAQWVQALINSIKMDNTQRTADNKRKAQKKVSLEYIFRNYSLSFGFADEIYDGDTIKLEDDTQIRYLGVDTPEITHGESGYNEEGGQEAYRQNRVLVGRNRLLIVKPKKTKHDSYGRLLAYIYSPVFEDGNFYLNISRYLVENGYGQEIYDNYDRDLLLKLSYSKVNEFTK